MSSPQRLNDEMVGLWRTEFVHHDLYSQDAYARALQFALTRPGLVGAWGGVMDIGTPALVDVSGNGQDMTFVGNAHLDTDSNRPFTPYAVLDGTGDYLSRTDETKLDIIGTEAAVASALRGLTFSAWVRFDNAASAVEIVASKWNATGNLRSWILYRSATEILNASVSVDGTAVSATVAGASTLLEDVWYHVVVTYDPSASMVVYVNGVQDGIDNTSIPASLFNSSADLRLGTNGAATQLMTGRIALPWLAASVVSADLISYYYHMTRRLFGV